jgi:PST family polysaccharide transporter
MVIQFVGLIAFSHLLSPRDVGLIAMMGVFLMLGELLRDFGLSQAAIQTAKLSHAQASNLFWSMALVGLLLTGGLVLAAPAIA